MLARNVGMFSSDVFVTLTQVIEAHWTFRTLFGLG